MSQYVETPTRTFTAGAALGQFTRVVLSSGVLAAAGITDREIGTLEVASLASGDVVPVRLRNAPGTVKMVAAAAIAAGADVFTAASGRVSVSASTARRIGTALEAAAAAGDVIEVLRTAGDETAVV